MCPVKVTSVAGLMLACVSIGAPAGAVRQADVAPGVFDRTQAAAPTPPPPDTASPPQPVKADDAPRLPPFAGTLVNYDRNGARVAACAQLAGDPVKIGPRSVARTFVWVIDGELVRQLGSTPGTCDPAWSPDGSRLAVVAANGLWTYSPTLEDPRQLVEARTPEKPADEHDYATLSKPKWSPDGRRIAFLINDEGTGWVEAVDSTTGRRLFKSDTEVYSFEWTSDPRALRISNRTFRMP